MVVMAIVIDVVDILTAMLLAPSWLLIFLLFTAVTIAVMTVVTTAPCVVTIFI